MLAVSATVCLWLDCDGSSIFNRGVQYYQDSLHKFMVLQTIEYQQTDPDTNWTFSMNGKDSIDAM